MECCRLQGAGGLQKALADEAFLCGYVTSGVLCVDPLIPSECELTQACGQRLLGKQLISAWGSEGHVPALKTGGHLPSRQVLGVTPLGSQGRRGESHGAGPGCHLVAPRAPSQQKRPLHPWPALRCWTELPFPCGFCFCVGRRVCRVRRHRSLDLFATSEPMTVSALSGAY